MMRRRMSAAVERNAPGPDPEREQAPDGELGAEGAGSDQPAPAGGAANTCRPRCRCSSGNAPSGLQAGTSGAARRSTARRTASGRAARATTRRPGGATGMDCPAGARERGRAEAPWQEHGRQGGGEAA